MSEMLWPLRIYQSIPTNPRGQLGCTLEADGTFHLGIPGVLHGRPEIGYYLHNFGPERAHEFRLLVEQAGVWELPGLDALYPEQPNLYFVAGDWEGDKRSVTWSMDAIPDEVLPIMDAFHRLVEEARASPREVLAGAARWLAPSFSAREPLQLEFTLHNKGSEPISLQDPMTPYEGTSPLVLLISPAPSPDGRRQRHQRIELSPDVLFRPDQARPHAHGQPGDRLELAAGQSVRFVAAPSTYLSPGEHEAVLLLDTGGGMDVPPNHVRGLLAVDTPPLRIVHR